MCRSVPTSKEGCDKKISPKVNGMKGRKKEIKTKNSRKIGWRLNSFLQTHAGIVDAG